MRVSALEIGQYNKNGRLYPRDIIDKALEDSKEELLNNRLFIENNTEPSQYINLADVVGLVTDVVVEDDKLMVEVKSVGNFQAGELEHLLNSGKFHIRPKGLGNFNDKGVVSDYKLISFQLTSDPA